MSTAEEVTVPNTFEWLEHFCQQEMIDYLEVPFGAVSDAVSDGTNFGDDAFIPPGSDTALMKDETMPGPDHVVAVASNKDTEVVVLSPENSSAASAIDLSPKTKIAKQVKRRSRASRRTPTTLLNASIKNFRALVQQYTGCNSATSGFNRSRKGPITLNFGAPNEHSDFPASFHGDYYAVQSQFQEKLQNVEYATEFSAFSHAG